MNIIFPITYTDKFGAESTSITNDGQILKLSLRGVEFSGNDFYSFRISPDIDELKEKHFNLFERFLCGYSMQCQISVLLVNGKDTLQTTLIANIEYGEPVEGRTMFTSQGGKTYTVNKQIDLEILKLGIEYLEKTYTSSGKNGYNTFDEQLTDLKSNIPADVYLKICWNCAFSDYHPTGSGSFGDLACFRNTKNEYRQVIDKQALMALWNKQAESVQEINLCPDFELRKPSEGGLYVG
jgi:hypothetical protein